MPLLALGSVSAAVGRTDVRYRVRRDAGGLSAKNAAQGLVVRFGASGVEVSAGRSALGLALHDVGPVAPVASANRVVYRRPGVTERMCCSVRVGTGVPRSRSGRRTTRRVSP